MNLQGLPESIKYFLAMFGLGWKRHNAIFYEAMASTQMNLLVKRLEKAGVSELTRQRIHSELIRRKNSVVDRIANRIIPKWSIPMLPVVSPEIISLSDQMKMLGDGERQGFNALQGRVKVANQIEATSVAYWLVNVSLGNAQAYKGAKNLREELGASGLLAEEVIALTRYGEFPPRNGKFWCTNSVVSVRPNSMTSDEEVVETVALGWGLGGIKSTILSQQCSDTQNPNWWAPSCEARI